jgi:hypothetical protein
VAQAALRVMALYITRLVPRLAFAAFMASMPESRPKAPHYDVAHRV